MAADCPSADDTARPLKPLPVAALRRSPCTTVLESMGYETVSSSISSTRFVEKKHARFLKHHPPAPSTRRITRSPDTTNRRRALTLPVSSTYPSGSTPAAMLQPTAQSLGARRIPGNSATSFLSARRMETPATPGKEQLSREPHSLVHLLSRDPRASVGGRRSDGFWKAAVHGHTANPGEQLAVTRASRRRRPQRRAARPASSPHSPLIRNEGLGRSRLEPAAGKG